MIYARFTSSSQLLTGGNVTLHDTNAMKTTTSSANIIASVLVLFLLAESSPAGQSPAKEAPNSWTRAEAAMKEHLQAIDANMRSAEVKSARLSKYFPDLRLFVRFDRHMHGETRIFFINQLAEITPINDEEWRGDIEAECFRVPSVANFLRGRKIKVSSVDDALEAAKLFEELQGAANYVAFVKINTNDFTVFDKRFMEMACGANTTWKYTAAARPGGWTVKREYVGPPAMIEQPPTYEIDLNAEQEFLDLRRYPYLKERS